jgi:hypothetical protein
MTVPGTESLRILKPQGLLEIKNSILPFENAGDLLETEGADTQDEQPESDLNEEGIDG